MDMYMLTYIKANYGRMTPSRIAFQLGIPKHQVNEAARIMGLMDKDEEEEDDERNKRKIVAAKIDISAVERMRWLYGHGAPLSVIAYRYNISETRAKRLINNLH